MHDFDRKKERKRVEMGEGGSGIKNVAFLDGCDPENFPAYYHYYLFY